MFVDQNPRCQLKTFVSVPRNKTSSISGRQPSEECSCILTWADPGFWKRVVQTLEGKAVTEGLKRPRIDSETREMMGEVSGERLG